jgi:spore coat polysaccharide biosynthesis protein SpsF
LPDGAEHDPVEREARRFGGVATTGAARRPGGVATTRGPEHDVLRRTRMAADHCGATRVMRVTSDCPLLDPAVAARVLEGQARSGSPYAATALERGYPIGLDVEVVDARALRAADDEATDPYEREHVTAFLWRRPERYPAQLFDREPDRRAWRLALDTPEDYEVIRSIYANLHPADPAFGFDAVESLLLAHPELLRPSAGVAQRPYVGIESKSAAT